MTGIQIQLPFDTVADRTDFEPDPSKGSRFIASVAPIATAEDAQAFVEQVKLDYPGASHYVWAYRLGIGAQQVYRSTDDGEPGGSSGRPVLAQLEGHDLTNLVVVVTRYFGGTKLGVGGLMRAYGGAAGMVLDRAVRHTEVPKRELSMTVSYADVAIVERLVESYQGEIKHRDFAEQVAFTVELTFEQVDEFYAAVTNATAGRVQWPSDGDEALGDVTSGRGPL